MNRSGVFYGWRIVGVSMITQAIQAGLMIYAFGTIAVELEAEFGSSRRDVMFASTLLSIVTNILSPICGNLVDRHSIKRLMMAAIIAMSSGLLIMANATALWQVWLVFATVLPFGNLMLGQLPTSALMTRWFVKKRGRAMGIAATGTSLGGFIVPLLMSLLISDLGWRSAVMIMAAAVLLLALPLIALVIADSPGKLGLNPDGESELATSSATAPTAGTGFREILSEPAFWLEAAAVGLSLFIYLGFLSNLVPHAMTMGVTGRDAGVLMSLVAICSVAGKLGLGALADKLDLRATMWISHALMMTGSLVLAIGNSSISLSVGAAIFGLAAGGLLPVWGAMVAKSFGAAKFGRALGIMNLTMAPITAMSPFFAGWAFDAYGNYTLLFYAYAAIAVLAAAVLLPLKFDQEVESQGG